jgi:pimeloyl-ACP methyl ester carboxylesterase
MRFLSLLFFCWVSTSCIQFRLSEEEFVSTFENQEVLPKQADLIIDSSNIHYVYTDQGRDELLVFVHGSPGSWSAFIDFFKNDSLLSRFDMVSIDRPGFGDSDYGMPEKSLEKQAYFLSKVIELFPQKNKIMIGHSLGGPVIARIAMDYPNLTQGMVMVAPSIDPDMEKYEWYRTWIGTKIVGAMTPKDFWVSNEEILPLKEELQLMLPLWQKIIIPTVLVQGTKDILVPKENAEFARKMFRTEILTINYLEGVNHFIPWSNPEEIVRGIYLVSR